VPGYVPYTDLPSYYGIADVFVHAAKNEPYGVSVAEALASGLPVIASSMVGSAVDLIVQGQNGYIYQSGDAGQLAAHLERVLDSTDRTEVRRTSGAVLWKWGYESTWKAVLECLNQD
jgi:glycosyltransferase involved in cell wall biosynthesis